MKDGAKWSVDRDVIQKRAPLNLTCNLPDSQGHPQLPSTLLHAKLLQLADNLLLSMLYKVNRHDIYTREGGRSVDN